MGNFINELFKHIKFRKDRDERIIEMISFSSVLLAILNDCKRYIDDYYSVGIMIGACSGFIYCLVLMRMYVSVGQFFPKRIVRDCIKVLAAIMLGFYCYVLIGITVLSRDKINSYIIRPIPFSTWGTDQWHLTLWVENILMLIPMAVLLYILWKPFRKIGCAVCIGFLFSFTIECIQLLTQLGKFETDDIMNNVFGTLIGFAICKCVDRKLPLSMDS